MKARCQVTGKASSDPLPQPVGVFVLDDQEIVRTGVRGLLEAEPDLRVVGEAGTASAALTQIPALRPDVAVLDVRLPDGDGVSVCREVRSRVPEVACLMFTAFGDEQALLDSVLAGAAGYVLKQIRGSDLVGAVRAVASGQSLLDARAASQLMTRLLDKAAEPDPLAELAPYERGILELIGEGLTNREIGKRLLISEKTVKNYASTLFRKLGLEQRTAAAAYAARTFGPLRAKGSCAGTNAPTGRVKSRPELLQKESSPLQQRSRNPIPRPGHGHHGQAPIQAQARRWDEAGMQLGERQ